MKFLLVQMIETSFGYEFYIETMKLVIAGISNEGNVNPIICEFYCD